MKKERKILQIKEENIISNGTYRLKLFTFLVETIEHRFNTIKPPLNQKSCLENLQTYKQKNHFT